MQLSLQKKLICLQALFTKSTKALEAAWRPLLRLRWTICETLLNYVYYLASNPKKWIKQLILWKYAKGEIFKFPHITAAMHSGQIGWQNLFGHSLLLKLFLTFWMLLDIERSFVLVRAILEQNLHAQMGQ